MPRLESIRTSEIDVRLDRISKAAEDLSRSSSAIDALRLQTSPSFAALWLVPRLWRFNEKHPEIKVKLTASHVHAAPLHAEIDVEIRYGRGQWPDLRAGAVFEEEVLPLVNPKLKAKLNFSSTHDLVFQNLISSRGNLVQWPHWFAAHNISISPSAYAFSFDQADLSIQAGIQGLGIALESDRLAEGALRLGSLVPVFPERKGLKSQGHFLVYPRSHAKYKKVERFVTWMRGEVMRRSPL